MGSELRVLVHRGVAMAACFDAVARLRVTVFRHFPYLYEGDAAYEKHYLAMYARSAGGVLVLALAGEQIVGAATGLPLGDAEPVFQAPFVERGIPVEQVFYCGESMLLPAYRGFGVGHRFFDEREAHARTLGGVRWTAFAAVDRAQDDPRRPPDYRGNDPFWTRRGYRRHAQMPLRLPWREVGAGQETEQTLTMWLRPLERAP